MKRSIEIANDLQTKFPQLFHTGIQILQASTLSGLHYPPFSTSLPVLITSAEGSNLPAEIMELLANVYPDDTVVLGLIGKNRQQPGWQELTFGELHEPGKSLSAIYLPTLEGTSLEEFMEVIAHLRAPDGCPWDKKQTHVSLRPYLLEETYEALDALDKSDLVGLREELGDLFLQIALHSEIASENGTFRITDVLRGINQKIVSRHPHVFGTTLVENETQVVQNWEKIKEMERAENGSEKPGGLLDGIPVILPSLTQAQSIQERAARVGFDWPEITPVLQKVYEELDEVITARNDEDRAKELGDLLFAVVNLVRWHKVDAESALRQTNTKFRKRFAYIEQQAKISCRELQKMTLEEMDVLWEAAKEFDD